MTKTTSIKSPTRIDGFLYFLQIPLGILYIIYVPKSMIVIGKAEKSASNILANKFLFRLSIAACIAAAAFIIGLNVETLDTGFLKVTGVVSNV